MKINYHPTVALNIFFKAIAGWLLVSITSCFLISITSCSTGFNPLEEYDALEPTTTLEGPAPAKANEYASKGKYLVEILGCSTCHTDGALVGEPNLKRRLAGSGIGIAYTNPFENKRPGVIYPPNLTPDPTTGIGLWSKEQLVNMIKSGINRHGSRQLPVMPWPAYAKLSEADAQAIASYLLSLPPVEHKVPAPVKPGQRAPSPYVHFGIYQSKKQR